MDTLLLSRIQFGANISFHILFPTITIALGWVLLFFKLRFNATGDRKWMDAYMFWVKVFALSFAMGVVSGITMSFQFGTNWPGFMETVGNIAGPLLAYEVLTAFFLEAAFLGIMLFGASRVPPWAHTGATFLVAFGTTVSAFWIIVLNSWMHTPQGFEMRDGVAHATDWFAIVFNPSMPYRLVHMLLASGLTVAFLMAGISALRLLLKDQSEGTRTTLRTGIIMGAVLIPLQIYAGDLHGLNTLEHQPAKVAAMEGNWETQPNAPLLLFAIPNKETRSNDYEIGIPSLASIILTHQADGVVPGLNDFVAEDGTVLHPPVLQVFWAFRIMVGTGLLMLLVSWVGVGLLWRRGAADLPKYYLVHHRNRPPTLACGGRHDHGTGGQRRARAHGAVDADRVPCRLCRADARLYGRHHLPGNQGRQGRPHPRQARHQPRARCHPGGVDHGSMASLHLRRSDGRVHPDLCHSRWL
jgi:cytochrome bd ubiquinol oxidase subunit I